MLKNLKARLIRLSREHVPFDPSQLNDPVAAKTKWTPAKGGGANFKTHNLVQVNMNRMKFSSSLGAKIFYSLFLLMGLGLAVVFLYQQLAKNNSGFTFDLLFPSLFGLFFAVVGGLLLYFGTKPIVFEKSSGYFWKGRKNPETVYNMSEVKDYVKLKDIYALQIISEYIKSSKSSYYSYELNLVLNDASRINVIDHGNLKKIRKDTLKLSQFLRKPVWDATIY
ncbi:hypothetical protein MNBD_IGNAVI01-2953 [hydrothermal vent metagenome]|uniref:Uncharacterized protein n=1 Tax=hydrothermal vent metagenome TaxID=652676 RepID=A0A3B1D8M2_9ZZZZ